MLNYSFFITNFTWQWRRKNCRREFLCQNQPVQPNIEYIARNKNRLCKTNLHAVSSNASQQVTLKRLLFNRVITIGRKSKLPSSSFLFNISLYHRNFPCSLFPPSSISKQHLIDETVSHARKVERDRTKTANRSVTFLSFYRENQFRICDNGAALWKDMWATACSSFYETMARPLFPFRINNNQSLKQRVYITNNMLWIYWYWCFKNYSKLSFIQCVNYSYPTTLLTSSPKFLFLCILLFFHSCASKRVLVRLTENRNDDLIVYYM